MMLTDEYERNAAPQNLSCDAMSLPPSFTGLRFRDVPNLPADSPANDMTIR